jgi:hypothetical protein
MIIFCNGYVSTCHLHISLHLLQVVLYNMEEDGFLSHLCSLEYRLHCIYDSSLSKSVVQLFFTLFLSPLTSNCTLLYHPFPILCVCISTMYTDILFAIRLHARIQIIYNWINGQAGTTTLSQPFLLITCHYTFHLLWFRNVQRKLSINKKKCISTSTEWYIQQN